MLNTLSRSPLSRGLIALAAVFTSGTLFIGSATNAFAQGEGYRIEAAGISGNSQIIRDTIWSCDGTACTARKITSRPAVVCATAARKFGKIDAFVANGAAFSADELAACNAKAK